MTFENDDTFGIVDYCVFATVLAVSTGIGIFMSFKGNKTPEDFLFGNRSLGPVPVSMSLLTSVISSIALLGFSGETYAFGLQFSLMVVGIVLALIFSYFISLPVLFPLKLTSINEYITMRFKSKNLCSLVLLMACLNGFMYAGICLYAPTLAMSSVTSLSTTSYIYLLGIICTLYSTIGGIRAVIWTDVFQLAVVVIGLNAILILGCYKVGGLTSVWKIAIEGGRFDVFNMNIGIYERRTLPNVISYGFFYYLAIYSTSQLQLQRIGCVQTIQNAKYLILSNIFGYIYVYFLVFTCGIMCYATYVGCDPLKLGKLTKSDQILPFFVIDELSYIAGLPGIFIALLISGALSSLSSVISSQVSMIWNDCLLHFHVFAKATPPVAALISKVLSMIVGVIIIGIALLASAAESLVQINVAVSGASIGPLLGLFMLGLLFPRCNTKGAWCGVVISWIFIGWLTIGGLTYGIKSKPLPSSIEDCTELTNSTFKESERLRYDIYVLNETKIIGEDSSLKEDNEHPLMGLYGISSLFYTAIGSLLCIIVGLIVSYSTGSQNLSEVSPTLITPCVRRLYWNKQELLDIEMKKIENI